jgi:hypothetical protein
VFGIIIEIIIYFKGGIYDMDRKNRIIGVEAIGIFLLGITLSVILALILGSEIYAVATSICYSAAILSESIHTKRQDDKE